MVDQTGFARLRACAKIKHRHQNRLNNDFYTIGMVTKHYRAEGGAGKCSENIVATFR